MSWRAWIAVLFATTLVASPLRLRLVEPRRAPALAIVAEGADPEELERLGLIAPMRSVRSDWRASTVRLMPGRVDALWRRVETGRAHPGSLPSLFDGFGIEVLGEWGRASDAALDRQHLKQAAELLAGAEGSHSPSAVVVVLSCKALAAAVAEECGAVLREAISQLDRKLQSGDAGFGFFLTLPTEPHRRLGTIWAAGRQLKQTPSFRFREIDLAPTLLYLADFPIPLSIDGVPAFDLIAGEHIFHRPIEFGRGGS